MIERILDFIELQAVAGFFEYDETLKRSEGEKTGSGTIISTKGLITPYQQNAGLSFCTKITINLFLFFSNNTKPVQI